MSALTLKQALLIDRLFLAAAKNQSAFEQRLFESPLLDPKSLAS
jgi:hypothetical protein